MISYGLKASFSYILFCLLLLTARAGGQETQPEPDRGTTEEEIERITVTAPYEPLDPRNVSSQVSVVGADEIRASGARNAAEVVAPVLGVQIDRYGGITAPSVVSIRGSSPEQVLVLVNGKRLNSAQGGGVDFSTINPQDIERVEVVRGGASALYGENAFGGVINIITKDGYGKDFSGFLEYGYASFNTHTLTGQLIGSFGKDRMFDFFLSASGLYTDGGYRFPDEHSESGFSTRTNTQGMKGDTSFKIGWDIVRDAGLRVALSGQTHNDSKGVPGLKEFPTEEATMEDSRYMGMLSLLWQNNPLAGLSLDVYGLKQVRHYQDPGFYLGEVDDTHDNVALGTELGLSRQDDFRFLLLSSKAGYSFRYDYLVSTGLLKAEGSEEGSGEVFRTGHSGYARTELNLFPFEEGGTGRVVLFPAVRFDANRVVYESGGVSTSPNAFSFNFGLLLPFNSERSTLIKANVGTSYRVPSFDDLFWPATSFAVGNPELKPEEAFIYDIGLLVQPVPFFSFEIVHFSQDVTNLIQWNPGASGQWRPENIGKALINGVELESRFLFQLDAIHSYLELRGNYTYLFARDKTEGSATFDAQLPRRPFERANIAGTLTHVNGHSLRVEGRYVGYRYITAQNTKYLPSYFVLDTTLNLQILENFTMKLTVKNLLGEEYVDIREFPIPGREIGVMIGARF
ncbi:MAG TPA: TonB-dependent receptor [Spirochaetia bacterium]|nr:TonB-dependent receptor [Spirochaetia bacterium]